MLNFILYTVLPLVVILWLAIYMINRLFQTDTLKKQESNKSTQQISKRGNKMTASSARRRLNREPDSVPVRNSETNRDRSTENDNAVDPTRLEGAKIGTKKRAKLEAKAEKKAQREVELRLREERKRQEEFEDQDRMEREEEEKKKEELEELARQKEREEKLKKDEEEYQKMKEEFSIENEGFEEELDEEGNLLQRFIEHIKEKKVVMLEDLASTFHLKMQVVIDRIEEFQANGTLTGVIDDRGKFIYITEAELKSVADFVKKRGRVSIQELVENSNQLIVLNQS